jgi:hypothetical protein
MILKIYGLVDSKSVLLVFVQNNDLFVHTRSQIYSCIILPYPFYCCFCFCFFLSFSQLVAVIFESLHINDNSIIILIVLTSKIVIISLDVKVMQKYI